MSNATIALLQRIFERRVRVPEYVDVNSATQAERLTHIAICARHGYFSMSYTPLMFPFVAEMRFE